MTILTVTAKGQVTLKKDLLRHLGIQPGDKLEVGMLPGGKVEVRAVPMQHGSFEAFFGSLSNDHNLHFSIEEINEAIAASGAGEP